MKTLTALIAAALLLTGSWSAHSQVVQVTPTNYIHTVTGQNNLGKWIGSWTTETIDLHALAGRTLIVSHTVWFNSMKIHWVHPKRIETRFTYRYQGGSQFVMTEACEIQWQAPLAAGSGWVALTNQWQPSAELLQWSPTMSGTVTLGNDVWRTITTGSAVQLQGRNLMNAPRILKIPVFYGIDGCYFLKRFEANESKGVSLSRDTLEAYAESFLFDLESASDIPVL